MDVIKKLYALQQEKKQLSETIKSLDSEIKAYQSKLEMGLQVSDDGEYVVDVKPTVRFDAATAKEILTDELYDMICEKKPTSTLAKRVLTGEEYDDCQKVVGVSAVVKVAALLG